MAYYIIIMLLILDICSSIYSRRLHSRFKLVVEEDNVPDFVVICSAIFIAPALLKHA